MFAFDQFPSQSLVLNFKKNLGKICNIEKVNPINPIYELGKMSLMHLFLTGKHETENKYPRKT